MVTALIIIGALVVVFTLLNMKTSRPDGKFIKEVHPYRTLLMHIMPTRGESVVFYDEYALVDELDRYVAKANERFHVDYTHCLVGAIANGLKKSPAMNRFVMGHRLYERNEMSISFSMKRQKLNKKAKLAAVKREVPEDQSFYDLVQGINSTIKVERSDAKTYQDKELGPLSKIPRPILKVGVKLLMKLDYYGLLPKSFIKNDAMYTSIFAANLGSLGMSAGFHHLYEWGNCPIFLMMGAVEERPMVVDGQVVVRRVLPLRFTFEERVDDGLNAGFGVRALVNALEHPFAMLGCLAADGSDDHPIGEPPASKGGIPAGCVGASDWDEQKAGIAHGGQA